MTRAHSRGFSLIEVLASTALLAGVLVSMAWLMILATRQADSARSSTEALSVASTILEEMQGWGFHQTYTQFGFDGSATIHIAASRTNAYAAKWQPILDDKLPSAEVVIKIESLSSSVTPPPLASTRAIRVTVLVRWIEKQRTRDIQVSTVRM